MNFLHSEYQNLGPENVIEVTLDAQANVTLLDDTNFYRYRSGQSFEYQGGLAKRSPIFMSPSHRGHWHLVVDLGGYAGNVKVGTRLVR